MIQLGMLIAETDGFKSLVNGDCELRHVMVSKLMPYYITYMREKLKLPDGKKDLYKK